MPELCYQMHLCKLIWQFDANKTNGIWPNCAIKCIYVVDQTIWGKDWHISCFEPQRLKEHFEEGGFVFVNIWGICLCKYLLPLPPKQKVDFMSTFSCWICLNLFTWLTINNWAIFFWERIICWSNFLYNFTIFSWIWYTLD